MSVAPLPVIGSGPESLFRLGPMAWDGTTVSSSMPVGPWLNGPDGRPFPAATGVLIDDVLGYAIIAARPPGRWSVSTEITLDVLEPLPLDGTVRAEASVVHADALGGFATGRVLAEDGHLLAVCSQRGRFVPVPDDGLASTPWDEVTGSRDVVPWLEHELIGTPARPVPDLLANPMGNVHGGVSLCLAALAATSAASDHLEVASVHIVYARAIRAGSELGHRTEPRHSGRGLSAVAVTGEADGRPATLSQVVLHPRDR